MPEPNPKRDLIRHTVATLAYRGRKAVIGVEPGFGSFRAHERIRAPVAILAHVGDLLEWAATLARGEERWHDSMPGSWEAEVERFFGGLATLDDILSQEERIACPEEQLFQGPIADALTHIGQIAILRRAANLPVKGENYFRAQIQTGRVGREQSHPVREFD